MSDCWHHYVPDLDGVEFCDRCGDCPAEREKELDLKQIFETRDAKSRQTLVIGEFDLPSGKKVWARMLDDEGNVVGSVELPTPTLVYLRSQIETYFVEGGGF